MDTILFHSSVFLLAAVVAVPLAARSGLGSVLGYLLAGIVIGPVLGLTGAASDLQHVAEFGVVMMLFLIGLELDPSALWHMRDKLIGLGGLQLVGTAGAVMIGAMLLGQDWSSALAIGLILALSSTAIVLQTLNEKGLMQTNGGRSSFSVLLTQDIAVIPMLIILPLLAGPTVPMLGADGSIQINRPEADAHHTMSLVEGLPGWGVALVTFGAVASIILLGIYAARPVFRFIHSAKLREMYTALALLIVIGIAFLMTLVGLSPALGTFLAGLVLANSEFRHELESDIEPFKGLLLGLFFITVGAGIDFATFLKAPFTVLGLTAALILLKGGILFGLGMLFGLRRRNLWLFTLSLAQAGEFGFVLLSFSRQQNVLTAGLSDTLFLVVALTMLTTPLLFILYDVVSRRLIDAAEQQDADEIDEEGPVIIAGIGRFGQVVNRLVQSTGHATVVLDNDMKMIERMRRFGLKGFFGDPTRPDVLHAAGLAKARVLVVALDDPNSATRLTAYARRVRPDLHIITRAKTRTHVYELYQAGADDIVRELFDSSLRAGRYVLENIGLSEYEAAQAEQTFYHHDRAAVRELAKVWKPGIASTDNPEYIARVKELEKELKMALMAALDQEVQKPN